MRLNAVLDNLNSFEKNSFLKILDSIISTQPKNSKKIDEILTGQARELKNVDNVNIAEVFNLIENEYINHVKTEFVNATSQLDILIDIIIRDGNCIMKHDWFARLYEAELREISKKVKQLDKKLKSDSSDIEEKRREYYSIYKACLETAFSNDERLNLEKKITEEEQSILITLSDQLELSQEEVKLINYTIIPISQQPIDDIINELKNIGVLFYSKKNHIVYIPDEIVRALRKVRGKEVADKYLKRVLRLLREPQLNLICKKHNINWKVSLDEKIHQIINEGISFRGILKNDIYRDGTTLTERKKFLNEICNKGLKITPILKGTTIDEKIDNLINHFERIEKDDKVSISINGYEKLLIELYEFFPEISDLLKKEFQLQDKEVLRTSYLLDYNIKPRDVLEIIPKTQIKKFCEEKGISTRGDEILNILDSYKDSQNLYLENFELFGYRDLAGLKENGIKVKESKIGSKYEELTKFIFSQLGFNVDEDLKRKFNTRKDKIDILINLGNRDVILIECKTVKESGFNKFSSVSRQLKSYAELVKKNDFKVIKSLLVAPEFSDDFINECELEYDLNLSLITSKSLKKILEAFDSSKHKKLPYKLLMRDVLIQEDRIIKSLSR